jgi:penicillin-binding protein 1A
VSNKRDLNRYNTNTETKRAQKSEDEFSVAASETAKSVGGIFWKVFLTAFMILVIAGTAVLISVATFIWSMRNEEIVSLTDQKLNYSSTVYKENTDGTAEAYMQFHATENRTWVDFVDIPQSMKDAMVAIEDKRFYEHKGVDWQTTIKAAINLATGHGGAGGSTITQQLVKNVTGQNDVSILRKVKEIFCALNLEKKYTKDEILEYYLNLVNFGSGNNGVEAAAKTYFGKDIKDCDIAECACIAGITQNPYAYTPILHPEANKKRQQIVLGEMYSQGMITKDEYDAAMAESNNMNWAFNTVSTTGTQTDEEQQQTQIDSNDVWDWYTETMFRDILNDLVTKENISYDLAYNKIYNGGLSIYSCIDTDLQTNVQNMFQNLGDYISDDSVLFGFYMMDYSGKVLALSGSRYEKTANLVFNTATDAKRQAGSSFKAISVYSTALDLGKISFGTVLKDQPLPNYFGPNQPGPNNYSGTYYQYMNVDKAVEISQNAPAAQLCNDITPQACYSFLTDKLHFTTLDAASDQYSISAMAIGGLNYGVTVKEMTSGFQIFGNGGNYNDPYTYYYVLDHDGNIILDNRTNTPTKALSDANAQIMNKLLHKPVYGTNGTATICQIDGLDLFGKTGTTDSYSDLWFIGGTPYCVAGIWCGYNEPSALPTESAHKYIWKSVMEYVNSTYGADKQKEFTYTDNIVEKTFCRTSGLLAGSGCTDTAQGWYDSSNLPRVCNGGTDHIRNGGTAVSVSPSATVTPTPSASPTPSAQATPTPDVEPSTVESSEVTPIESTPESSEPEPSTPEIVSSEPESVPESVPESTATDGNSE